MAMPPSKQAPGINRKPSNEEESPVPSARKSLPEAEVQSEASKPQACIGRPAPGETPLGFVRLMAILISSHIGVRSRANREEDFRRANGLHVFIAGVIYFLVIITVLLFTVNLIAR